VWNALWLVPTDARRDYQYLFEVKGSFCSAPFGLKNPPSDMPVQPHAVDDQGSPEVLAILQALAKK